MNMCAQCYSTRRDTAGNCLDCGRLGPNEPTPTAKVSELQPCSSSGHYRTRLEAIKFWNQRQNHFAVRHEHCDPCQPAQMPMGYCHGCAGLKQQAGKEGK
jgi:hypothetical protein